MTGINVLHLNEATMIEILQYYFDNVLFSQGMNPKVTSVSCNSINSVPLFIISTKEPEVEIKK